MSTFEFVSFDCYGTLIDFQMSGLTRRLMEDRFEIDNFDRFLLAFSNYRYDEVLGSFKPYPDVIKNALHRTCERWTVPYSKEIGQQLVDAIPEWEPLPDVVQSLKKLKKEFRLVILSNAVQEQIQQNLDMLEVSFYEIFVSEKIGAYKPQFRPFEYMLDQLNCEPSDIVHVSSSLRYDIVTAHALRFPHLVHVDRGYDQFEPEFSYHRTADFSDVPRLLTDLALCDSF